MSTAVLDEPATGLPDGYPFHIGYRYIHTEDETGKITSEMVPLTEEDFLHPQEGDRFMLTLEHTVATQRLMHAILYGERYKPASGLFGDLRIDWQLPNIKPHGPDVIVFDHYPDGLPPDTGTLMVADNNLNVQLIVEVTSPETRHVDLGRKFDEYLEVGVPIFMVVDLAAPHGDARLLCFEHAGDLYREMDEDPKLGYLVKSLDLWFRLDCRKIMVADLNGRDIPDSAQCGFALDKALTDTAAEKARAEKAEKLAAEELARAEAETARANAATAEVEAEMTRANKVTAEALAEKARADAAAAEAATAKARAEELARELAELKARLNSNG